MGALSVTSSLMNQPQPQPHPQALLAASTIQSALNSLQLNPSQLGLVGLELPVAGKESVMDKHVNKENLPAIGNLAKPCSPYLAPGSANHNSYRQSLNPAIYNAYRSSPNSRDPAPAPGPGPASKQRQRQRQPMVHVIAETVYRAASGSGPASSKGAGAGAGKQDRFDKTSLFKTELCTNWMLTGSCTYGNKCHFAHGVDDLKARMRVENYKTQPCCDPAREGCRRCMYGRRCNYCHPGESIRRPHPTPYYDKDYYDALRTDFGHDNEFPFGIYV